MECANNAGKVGRFEDGGLVTTGGKASNLTAIRRYNSLIPVNGMRLNLDRLNVNEKNLRFAEGMRAILSKAEV